MAKRGIRVKDGEDISPSTIEKVIKYLSDEKGATKKAACDMLRINYNTTRLSKIIAEYEEQKTFTKLRRKQVRNTPLAKDDIKTICSMYLSGEPLSDITETTFRSSSVVKRVLLQQNIPLRSAKNNYQNPPLLPEDSIKEDYKKGDLVYSARYGSIAVVQSNGKMTKEYGMIYPIKIAGDYERSAYQPYYELSDLRKLQKEFGVEALYMNKSDIIHQINLTMSKSKKNQAKFGEF
jgi:hypothetical protein